MNRRIAPIAYHGLAAALLTALLAGRAPAAPETAPPVVVRSLGTGPVAGTLAGLDGSSVVVAAAEGARTLPLAEVFALEVQTARGPTLAARPHLRVILTGGEVVHGIYAGAPADSLTLDTPDLGTTTLPLESIATVVSVPADAGACFEPEHSYPPGPDDVAYVHSGDEYGGIVLGISDEGIEIETERGRTRRVAWNDLLVLHLSNDVPPPPEGLVVEVETVEGSRIEAAGPVVLEDGVLHLATRSVPRRALTLPLDQVRVLRPSGGAFVYASDLPFESELVPYYQDDESEQEYLRRLLAARTDRRSTGCPLRVAGVTYRHGFAVHSRSLVTLHPSRAYRRFEALFGIDDEALEVKAGGIVDARVLGDGKVLWEAKGVRGGEEPRRVGPLDVSQVEVLVLEVDFGEELFVRDRASWVNPLLFR